MNEEVDMPSNAFRVRSWLSSGEGVWFPLARFLSSHATLFRLQGQIRGSLVDADQSRLPSPSTSIG